MTVISPIIILVNFSRFNTASLFFILYGSKLSAFKQKSFIIFFKSCSSKSLSIIFEPISLISSSTLVDAFLSAFLSFSVFSLYVKTFTKHSEKSIS